MGILIAIIIGGIIGWLAAHVVGREEGMFGSIIIGIIGAFIGNLLAGWLGSGSQGYLVFTWPGLIWAFIGAVIFAAILNAFQHRSSHV